MNGKAIGWRGAGWAGAAILGTVAARVLLDASGLRLTGSPGILGVLGAAWLGGVAFPASWPALPVTVSVLGLLASILVLSVRNGQPPWEIRRRALATTASFCSGLATALVVTFSGFPGSYASMVYAGKGWVDLAAGGTVAVQGLVLVGRVLGLDMLGGGGGLGRRKGRHRTWEPALLGLAVGLTIYHDIDPTFDSAFFATGTAVATSHSPGAVIFFLFGAGLVYAATAWGLGGLQPYGPRARRGVSASAVLLDFATMGLGVALAVGVYHPVARGLGLAM